MKLSDDQCACRAPLKIELIDGRYPLFVPAFVFDEDLEFACDQGARAFHDIWQHHNRNKKA